MKEEPKNLAEECANIYCSLQTIGNDNVQQRNAKMIVNWCTHISFVFVEEL